MANLALVDDHVLLRKGLASILQDRGHHIIFQASNGEECLTKLGKHEAPEILILDINMPQLDGYETANKIRTRFPCVKLLTVSMYNDEYAVIRMIRAGARGFIIKDCEPAELDEAITAILDRGYYYSDLVSGRLINSVKDNRDNDGLSSVMGLSPREIEFIGYTHTEMKYKEIAAAMYVSPRTVDGYRDDLFKKLNVQSRVGIVMFGIRHGIIKI